jgi:hypothetical protein
MINCHINMQIIKDPGEEYLPILLGLVRQYNLDGFNLGGFEEEVRLSDMIEESFILQCLASHIYVVDGGKKGFALFVDTLPEGIYLSYLFGEGNVGSFLLEALRREYPCVYANALDTDGRKQGRLVLAKRRCGQIGHFEYQSYYKSNKVSELFFPGIKES